MLSGPIKSIGPTWSSHVHLLAKNANLKSHSDRITTLVSHVATECQANLNTSHHCPKYLHLLGNRHEAISRVPYGARGPAGADVIISWDQRARQNVQLSVEPIRAEDEPSDGCTVLNSQDFWVGPLLSSRGLSCHMTRANTDWLDGFLILI